MFKGACKYTASVDVEFGQQFMNVFVKQWKSGHYGEKCVKKRFIDEDFKKLR